MKEIYYALAFVHHVAVAALVVFVATPLPSFGGEGAQPAAYEESCVLLRNGNVLCGQVAKIGSTYCITRSDQSRINLPGDQVETVGRSIRQLYQYRRGNRFQGDLKRLHADVRWCLRNGLVQEAARDALEARALEPADPSTIQLLRQVAAVIRQQSASAEPASVGDPSPAVQTVSHESPVADDPAVGEDRAVAPPSGLPEKLVYEFASRIQPILMNRCTSCHARDGQNEREFQIHTALTSKWAPKDVARENLQAVMQFVDRSVPGNSLIRLRASDGHGGRRHSFGSEGSAMMSNLDRWLMQVEASQVAMDSAPSQWESESGPGSGSEALAPTSPPELLSVERPIDLASESAAGALPGSGEGEPVWNPGPSTSSTTSTGAAARIRRMPKVDNPFDPAIFNRRVHGR
ncbi:hypothetical protein Mal15_34270 [Stieleria maiorica]|uniref:Cytochrome c domain-containing protein n=1 Tax=Stieleria maiorica TaxID=2795974 RepID=A0A5B9MEW1_9BACT|nr:hypothetical protein [Stieleria maiorica]QEF99363.1 hypothetical protein Mal15_34270 [Stieleria maiorica]